MMALLGLFRVSVVYWDRQLPVRGVYPLPPGVSAYRVALRAPLGQPLKRFPRLMIFCARSIKLLCQLRPDVVHCGNLDMLVIGSIYRRFFNPGAKIVYEVGDLPLVLYNNKRGFISRVLRSVYARLERLVCRSVSLLVITSPYFWGSHYVTFVPQDRVLYLPNAPERRVFSAYRRKLHVAFTVGFIGSIRYPVQLKMLVDATRDLAGIRVLIAGDGASYHDIEEYATEEPHVQFHGPFNYEKEIADLYGMIDCVYAVYDPEIDNVRVALPNKLYEAIVCELPIIAAEGTELGRFITEHGIGLTVSANASSRLRQAISEMAGDPAKIESCKRSLQNLKRDSWAEAGFLDLRRRYERITQTEAR